MICLVWLQFLAVGKPGFNQLEAVGCAASKGV